MKKNEQLFDALDGISPVYIKEAAPANVSQRTKVRREREHVSRRTLVGMIAALVAVSMMMFALGFSASALTENEEEGQPREGTLLMDVPEMLTYNDMQWMVMLIEDGLATHTEIDESTRGHMLDRFKAFYTLQSLELQNSQLAREAMLRVYPVAEVAEICTLDACLTEYERDYLYHMMTTYGGMTQADLISMRQTLYDVVEISELPEEKKQHIRDTLPEVPTVSPAAPPAIYITAEAQAAGKSQMTPCVLPYVMLAEDFEGIRDSLLAKYGVDSVSLLPLQVQNMLLCYTKYPLESSNPENYQLAVDQHFAPLSADMELYVLNPSLSIEERVMLCYHLGVIADVWMEDVAQIVYHLDDALEAKYGDNRETQGNMEKVVWTYWKNMQFVRTLVPRDDVK